MNPPQFKQTQEPNHEIRALRAENKKLQSQIVKLEIKTLSLSNKVAALHKEIKQRANEKYLETIGKIMQRGSKN